MSRPPDDICFRWYNDYSPCSIHISYPILYFPQPGSRSGNLPVKNNLKDEKPEFGDWVSQRGGGWEGTFFQSSFWLTHIRDDGQLCQPPVLSRVITAHRALWPLLVPLLWPFLLSALTGRCFPTLLVIAPCPRTCARPFLPHSGNFFWCEGDYFYSPTVASKQEREFFCFLFPCLHPYLLQAWIN